MAVIEFRDDNDFVLFRDSEGWDQSVRKQNISLRVNRQAGILSVYDGTVKWFDIDPEKMQRPEVADVEDLRIKLELVADGNLISQKRSPFYTNFSRQKTSTEFFNFENRFEYSEEARFWDVVADVNSVKQFSFVDNSVSFEVGTAAGDKRVEQTRQKFRYNPGKQVMAKFGIIFEHDRPGLRQRAGYFEDKDGFYFEVDENGAFFIVRRSNASGAVVEERVPQSEWNTDNFDGFGISRETLDLEAIQMGVVEFSWYGAGSANFGFLIRGEHFYAHHFDAGNRLKEPIVGRPNLPIRFEIENITDTASNSKMRIFGATASEDGGTAANRGRVFIATRQETKNVGNSVFEPILSIRPRLNINGIENRTNLKIIDFQVTSDVDLCEYRVYHDGVLTGEGFTVVSDFIEKDEAATEVQAEQDDIVGGGYVTGGQNRFQVDTENLFVRFPFTVNHDATQANQITIAVKAVSANSANVRASVKGFVEF